MTDPIADMLTRIRNATIAHHTRVDIPASTLKLEIARILEHEGYIQSFKTGGADGDGKSAVQKTIRIAAQVRPARRARDHRHRAGEPSRPPCLLRARGSADGARRPRHQHPDHVARRDDRAARRAVRASAAKCSATCGELNMSRIGKKPIPIPTGVKIQVSEGAVEVQGPKGKLRQAAAARHRLQAGRRQPGGAPVREDSELGKFHGLARSLVANAVLGVTEASRRSWTSSASATAPS